ncbi:hypothetical protein VE04_03326 [Pseudogymnoascus sp. 24MN13]|nr:hypothetical protein VE04_03326 [Pseudogymnoascus sp. 24MN13]
MPVAHSGFGTFSNPVELICWDPNSGHVLGVYNDGNLFKWHPFNDKATVVVPADATALKCSPSGLFVVTSDDSGTLKIWTLENLSLVYQLSYASTVNDLAISPDGKRVYDLRGAYCNIWEPNLLIRLAEPDDRGSEMSSTSSGSTHISNVSESISEMHEPVEALAIGRKTSMYCTGHRNGALQIFESSGKMIQYQGSTSLAIDHVAWSDEENYLAVADVETRVCVKRVNETLSPLTTVFEERLGKSVQQLLFNKTETLLLATTEHTINVWTVEETPVLTAKSFANEPYQWINHPFNEALVVAIGPEDIRVLVLVSSEKLTTSAATTRLPGTHVKRILVSGDGSRIFLYLSQAWHNSTQTNRLLLINTADLDVSGLGHAKSITALALPENIQNHIDRPLGFIRPSSVRNGRESSLGDDQLTFLSTNGWLCTFSLDVAGNNASFKRYFFLPQDWLNGESLELAQVTPVGTLFCPKDGEVGLIRNGFRNEWLGGTQSI